MKIIQLEKTIETITSMDVKDYSNVYFLKLKEYKMKAGTDNYRIDSKRLDHVMTRDLEEYINDPEIILVKITKQGS